MSKTFTLPKDLLTQTTALTAQEPCELLDQTQIMNFISEEFERASFSPDQTVVDNILAYSKAVEVNGSKTMVEGHVVHMN
jgi:hypothetical protein